MGKYAGLILATVFLLVATGVSSKAKVILKEEVKYYDVRGKNGAEIYRSMIANGPKIDGKRGHALATTEFGMELQNVNFQVKNGRCQANSLDVMLKVKYTFPRWQDRTRGTKKTRLAWKHFANVVNWHEKQHVRIATDLAREYEKSFKKTKFRHKGTCSTDSLGLRMRLGSAFFKNNRAQRQFDRKDLKPGGKGYEAQLKLFKAE